MTREEAIIILTNTASLLRYGTRYMKLEHEKQFREAYEMAVKALEQPEPSQIARDIATIIENEQDMRVILKNGQDIRAVLKNVPPERKKGKWLPDNNNYIEERFICSVCGKSYKVDTCMGKPMWEFCSCGADMRGDI